MFYSLVVPVQESVRDSSDLRLNAGLRRVCLDVLYTCILYVYISSWTKSSSFC